MKEIPPEQSLIAYPSAFPIKVMGAQVDGFVEAIVDVARQFDPGFDPRRSRRGPARPATTWA
jgi:putative lipoic acid-binding regulatory protein